MAKRAKNPSPVVAACPTCGAKSSDDDTPLRLADVNPATYHFEFGEDGVHHAAFDPDFSEPGEDDEMQFWCANCDSYFEAPEGMKFIFD